jgi:hypothetical protein
MNTVHATDTDRTLGCLRRLLLVILLFGMTGTSIELLLLRHTEDSTQLIPLILLGMGFLTVAWNAARRSRLSVLTLQLLMVLFIVSGALGMFFHYSANAEFQLEMEPGLSGSNLWWKVLQAKTPPAIAPGVMAQLGLIGLAYAYRHPAVARTHHEIEENREDA